MRSARLTLIDIPIGLIGSGNLQRRCDLEARKVLGMSRSASVFSPPVRDALGAGNYEQALRINRRKTGKGISKQAWNIAPKIREVDCLMRSNPGLKKKVRECHPEICFWALNHKKPMAHNKKLTKDMRNVAWSSRNICQERRSS